MEWHRQQDALEEDVRTYVLQRVDLSRDVSDAELLEMIQNRICTLSEEIHLTIERRLEIQRRVFNSL